MNRLDTELHRLYLPHPQPTAPQQAEPAADGLPALIGADGIWSHVGAQLQRQRAPRFAHRTAWRALVPADRWRAALLGLVIGFYDGFFGPGTGSFLIFGFVRLFGMDFIKASASAKVINAATNVSAIAFFISHGPILWLVALVMAVCNLAGAQVGTALALRRGTGFVRQAFLLVVTLLIAKLAWDMLGG